MTGGDLGSAFVGAFYALFAIGILVGLAIAGVIALIIWLIQAEYLCLAAEKSERKHLTRWRENGRIVTQPCGCKRGCWFHSATRKGWDGWRIAQLDRAFPRPGKVTSSSLVMLALPFGV